MQKLSLYRTKKPSPSFIERRRRLLSIKDSTAGSSNGAQSQQPKSGLGFSAKSGNAFFGSDMFKGATSTNESIPKSVGEMPSCSNGNTDGLNLK